MSHRTANALALALLVLGACDAPATVSPAGAPAARRGPRPAPVPNDSTGPRLPYHPAPPLDTIYVPH